MTFKYHKNSFTQHSSTVIYTNSKLEHSDIGFNKQIDMYVYIMYIL